MTSSRKSGERKSWWNSRTLLEKWSLSLLSILVIVLLVITSLQVAQEFHSNHNICLTPACVNSAFQVLQKVDLTVDPCDDFYKFACGGFMRNTLMPEDKTSISAFSVVNDMVELQMRTLLERPIDEGTDKRPFVLAKSLYKACMNVTSIEANSMPTLKRIIKSTGGWPVIEGDAWNETDFNWMNTTFKFIKLGFFVNGFMHFGLQISPKMANPRILYLDQPSNLGYDKIMNKGFNDPLVQAYYEYLVNIALAFGANESAALKEMKDVVELDIALTEIKIPAEERRNASTEYNPMTVKDLKQKYPSLPWLDFFNAMLEPHKVLNDDDVIIVTVPKYFDRLVRLLKGRDKRTIANYLYKNLAAGLVPFLDEKIRTLSMEFVRIANGISERPPRWKECTVMAKGLHAAVAALYVNNFFEKDSKSMMTEMVTNIKNQLLSTIEKLDWMDDITKKHALEKAKTMINHIAYPDELLDDTKLEEYYRYLTFDPTKYLESIQNYSKFSHNYRFSLINSPINKTSWIRHAITTSINAFYNRNENSIDLPAGILQDVFFDNDRPQYMNYGAIGYIVGHEITHAFDDQGRQTDQNGALIDWWQPETKSAFDKRAKCIIDQYSNITVPEVNMNIVTNNMSGIFPEVQIDRYRCGSSDPPNKKGLNGINTQGENIADNGGVKQAYFAYKNWAKVHGPEPKLPALPYTPEQMFWISVGNTWCSVTRPEHLMMSVMSDPHSPNYYRVNIPLMNFEHFAKDFNCPVGSSMNPPQKCEVW